MMITTFLGHTGRVVPSNKMGMLSRSVCFVHSRARDADMILYWSKFVTIMSVTFCRTDYSKKKSHDIMTDQAVIANKSHVKHALVTPIVLSISSGHLN